MSKRLSIIILAQNTLLAKEIILTIKSKFNKKIKIIALSSDLRLKEYSTKLFNYKIKFVSNNLRNEHKLIEIIKKNKIDLLLSLQHRWIISQNLINFSNNNIYNFHFGKIPEFRGHDPIIYSILKKQKYFYSTIHKISKIVDTGEVLSEKKILNLNQIPRVIEKKMVQTFKLQFIEMLNQIFKKKKISIKKKINKKLKKYKKIKSLKNKKLINNVHDLEKKTIAFNHAPHEPAFFLHKKKKYYVLKDYKEYLKFKNKN